LQNEIENGVQNWNSSKTVKTVCESQNWKTCIIIVIVLVCHKIEDVKVSTI